jgi:hypothetical protein
VAEGVVDEGVEPGGEAREDVLFLLTGDRGVCPVLRSALSWRSSR